MPRESAGAGFIRTDVLVYQPEATDLTGTGALDLTSFTPGFTFEVEEFGFRVSTALTGGTNIYDLVDANNVVIASLSLASGGQGAKTGVFKSTNPVPTAPAGVQVRDSQVIKIRRRTGGTTISAGTGTFYVRGRQRLQQRG